MVGGGVTGARAGFVQCDGGGGGESRGAGLVLGMAAWRCFCLAGSGLARLLLLLLHLPLLVEDLLGLPVADEQHHGGKDQDDGAPGAAVAEAEAKGAGLAWTG